MKKTYLVIFIIVILVGVLLLTKSKNNSNQESSQIRETNQDADANKNLGRYIEYTVSSYEASSFKKRVLYFHAVWCPTCKVINEEFIKNANRIPEDVVVFITDYDKESALKKKYNITYQHTFVLVDEDGDEIKKWNGGGIEELIENTL